MGWVKLDDCFSEHPKVELAGDQAAWMYVCSLQYCSRALSDGFIPATRVARLTSLKSPQALAQKLVEVGLWIEVEDGYVIHDYHDYQRSAAEVKEDRRKTAERVAKHRAKKDAGGNASVTVLHDRCSNGDVTRLDAEADAEKSDTSTRSTSKNNNYVVIAHATTSERAA